MSNVPNDVLGVFVASFDKLRGQVLHPSSIAVSDIELEGIEFAALPSGYHLIENDVFSFAFKSNSFALVRFSRDSSLVPAERGGTMWALGVLYRTLPHALPTYHHLPFLERQATTFPQDFSPLHTYFKRHSSGPTTGGLGSTALATRNPVENFATHLVALGPIAIVLYKASLCRRRIMIYSPPPLQSSCELACYVWSIGRVLDLAEASTRMEWLGSVGLMDIDRLEELGKKGLGWIGCTTDALYRERPYLYDLLLDLSAGKPLLSAVTRTTTSHPHSPSHKLSPISYTPSDTFLYDQLVNHLPERQLQALSRSSSLWSRCLSSALQLCFGGGEVRLDGQEDPTAQTWFHHHSQELNRRIGLMDEPLVGVYGLLDLGLSLSEGDVILLRLLSEGKVDVEPSYLLVLGRWLGV